MLCCAMSNLGVIESEKGRKREGEGGKEEAEIGRRVLVAMNIPF